MAFVLASDAAGVLSQLSRRDPPGETTEPGVPLTDVSQAPNDGPVGLP
jgi:hypothetical protein